MTNCRARAKRSRPAGRSFDPSCSGSIWDRQINLQKKRTRNYGNMRSDRYADEQKTIEETEAVEATTAAETSSDAKERVDLAKLKKKDLLEIMLAQSKEIDELRAKVADLEAKLANREFEFEKIGSIAEASLAVTNIFKEAEEAAKIYLENIRRSYEKRSKEHSAE